MERDNITRVINLLIGELDIPVTRQSIEEEIARHPEYSSLLAISDVLNNWRVPNAAYELNFDELIAAEVPTPFVAHFKKGEFVLVTYLDSKHVRVSHQLWNNHKLTIDEFKELYGGSILIAEKDDTSGEFDYKNRRAKERFNEARGPIVITGAAIIFITFLLLNPAYTSAFNWQVALLTLFKTAGLTTAILLLIQSIDTNNPLIQKLCGADNNKDCNAILSSKAAKISEELSWSEIGFFYFAGTWLVLLFNNSNTAVMQMLALLNMVSLPYTFYSIYYQWRVAKQWCRFCCVVQGLLWLEFFAFMPYVINGIQLPDLKEFINLFVGMVIPVLAWIFVKPYLLVKNQITPLKQQLRKFKYNTDLFNKLLNNEPKYQIPAEDHTLILGNREAEHVITIVSGPYCPPCATAHKKLDEWLESREDIKLQIIFASPDSDEDPKTKIAAHLMALQGNRDDISLKRAVNDWYEEKQKNYDAWAKHYPVENINSKDIINIQREWCKTANIIGTPTIFINGRKLPNNYQTEDIRYFI
ncbi:MAG TPA: vitamin K epoxide reductase family protein [Mucilaginibacter sp.]|jgi:uncharacterized membrane protein|nr:vitamin K epoxide reductase family protein [Mucilaginibacter sp.]